MFKKSMLLVLVLTALIWAEKSNIHHEINATVDPASQFIKATDKITIPAAYVNPVIYFLLNSDLKIESDQTENRVQSPIKSRIAHLQSIPGAR